MAIEPIVSELQCETLLPNKELECYVRNYTLIKLPLGSKQLTFSPLPNGLIELFVCFNGSSVYFDANTAVQKSECFIKCLRSLENARKITISSKSGYFIMLLVSLTFKGAFSFFNYKFNKFFNQIIDLPDWLNHNERSVVNENAHVSLLLDKVNSALLNNNDIRECEFASVLDDAYNLLEECKGKIEVRELVSKLNRSYESVYRLFHHKLGVCPKVYSNIIRFKKVCEYLSKNPIPNWQKVVFEHGYYDQAHFINEFTRIMQKPPAEFMQLTQGGFYQNMPFKERLI